MTDWNLVHRLEKITPETCKNDPHATALDCAAAAREIRRENTRANAASDDASRLRYPDTSGQ